MRFFTRISLLFVLAALISMASMALAQNPPVSDPTAGGGTTVSATDNGQNTPFTVSQAPTDLPGAFNISSTSNNSASAIGTSNSGATATSFYGLLASLHNFAIVLMAIGIVVAGLFWMGGRPQLAIGVLGGSVVLFGAPAFVGLVSSSFTGAVNVDIGTGADSNSIEYQVAYVIVRIQNTVRGVSVILCALYGTLLGVDALLGGMDSARLNAFIIGVIMVIGSPFLVQVFSSVLNG